MPLSGPLADTVVASASAPGVGALAVVRMSGQGAHAIASRLIRDDLGPERVATWRRLGNDGLGVLDEAVVIRYDGPRSYTGEDSVEFICHGGPVTATRLVAALIEAGARPAEPGEFTRRAVLNGKMDVLQAEAVNDLIRAESSAGAILALGQLDGGLSRRLTALRDRILDLESLTAYEIDFPEEDDGPIEPTRIKTATTTLITAIDQLLATVPRGELIREGALVVIAGLPNVGKSSLFNALLGRRRALVTDIPGTTRDALEAVVDTFPVPLRLVDTAGLHETADPVERLGTELTKEYLARAQVVLACGDSRDAILDAVAAAREVTEAPVIRVRTKWDLQEEQHRTAAPEEIGVSALSGEGLERLIHEATKTIANTGEPISEEAPILAHERYHQVLKRAREELAAFQSARTLGSVPATVSSVHLRESVRHLETLIGTVDVEQILNRVFSMFCVGK